MSKRQRPIHRAIARPWAHPENKRSVRQQVCDRFGGRCAYCKRSVGMRGTLDHYVPRHMGGTSEQHNLKWACQRCNTMKGGMPPHEWELIVPRLSVLAPTRAERRNQLLARIAQRDAPHTRPRLMNQHQPDEQVIHISTRYESGAYVTNTVQGKRASCTSCGREAAIRLARKVFGDAAAISLNRDRRKPQRTPDRPLTEHWVASCNRPASHPPLP